MGFGTTWGPWQINETRVTMAVSSTLIKASTDLPGSYPIGVSLYRAMTGFPNNGQVTSFRDYDDIVLQFNCGFLPGEDLMAFRIGKVGSAWGAWHGNISKMAAQVDSAATEVAALRSDFNTLLAALRSANLMTV